MGTEAPAFAGREPEPRKVEDVRALGHGPNGSAATGRPRRRPSARA